MKQYRLLNNIFGWAAFVISAIVYLMTVEPTASFWDCPEFITSAVKLEVGHPPGNTFFNLTGRFFANFAGGDMTKVAYYVNCMSAICSAGTILFLFWTITHLVKKIVCSKEESVMTPFQTISILGSGMVGALIYTFSDTFWFSAVEAEVYAFSSLLTALVFWLILKWEDNADSPHADRYIILLCYMIGISIGVHLLNLLCIPAVVLVYYFKKVPEANLKGTLTVLAGSFVLIGLLLYGMIPGFVKLCGFVELFFVNTLGMRFNTGTLFYFFLVLATICWGVYETYKGTDDKRIRVSFIASVVLVGIPFIGGGYWLGILLSILIGAAVMLWKKLNVKLLNTTLLCLLVILIGYSSFAQIIIRSAANTPMDQNSPDEIFSFAKYLNREQYGDRPLFYGYTFVSEVQRDSQGRAVVDKGDPIYAKAVKKNPNDPDRYVISGYRENYVYTPELNMLFPRMYSNQRDNNHIQAYKEWSDFKGKPVQINIGGENKIVMKPTFSENLRFFFSYQLNFMYWRYFMWNFSGRQNDEQGYGEMTHGNWITGIKFIDNILVGDQDTLPSDMKDNKGRNVYYMLPLLLGIIGLLFQAYSGEKGIQGFWIVFLLFFMTGIAIVIYLNQTPFQPRERDYAYAGSFYAFAIWCGFGVAGIASILKKYLNPTTAAAITASVCLLVPVQMAAENWDDHDRSDRYIARDFGYNYLTCVEENGIIFTNGDNDTFPLWYAQEVEGYRRDVRVCNLSYLQTDWYITQMKSPAYTSESLPIGLTPDQYDQAKLNFAYVFDINNNEPISLYSAMQWLQSEDKQTKSLRGYNERIDYIPANKLTIAVDSAKVASQPCMQGIDPSSFTSNMTIDLSSKQAVMKNDIAILSMLDGISRNNWERPIYYATTVGQSMYMNLTPYFNLVGLAYQIAPVSNGGTSNVNIEKMYDNLVNKFLWGGVDTQGVYLDENCRRMCRSMRMMFARLINALIDQDEDEKALYALNFCMKKIPGSNVPHDFASLSFVQDYFILGEEERGVELANVIGESALENIRWYFSLRPNQTLQLLSEAGQNLAVIQNLIEMLEDAGQKELAESYAKEFQIYRNQYGAVQQNRYN